MCRECARRSSFIQISFTHNAASETCVALSPLVLSGSSYHFMRVSVQIPLEPTLPANQQQCCDSLVTTRGKVREIHKKEAGVSPARYQRNSGFDTVPSPRADITFRDGRELSCHLRHDNRNANRGSGDHRPRDRGGRRQDLLGLGHRSHRRYRCDLRCTFHRLLDQIDVRRVGIGRERTEFGSDG